MMNDHQEASYGMHVRVKSLLRLNSDKTETIGAFERNIVKYEEGITRIEMIAGIREGGTNRIRMRNRMRGMWL